MTCFAVDLEPYELDLVRIQLSANICVFTEANKVQCDKICCSFCDVIVALSIRRLLCGYLL